MAVGGPNLLIRRLGSCLGSPRIGYTHTVWQLGLARRLPPRSATATRICLFAGQIWAKSVIIRVSAAPGSVILILFGSRGTHADTTAEAANMSSTPQLANTCITYAKSRLECSARAWQLQCSCSFRNRQCSLQHHLQLLPLLDCIQGPFGNRWLPRSSSTPQLELR